MGRILALLVLIGLLAFVGLFDRRVPVTWSEEELARIKTLILPERATLKAQIVRTGNAYWDDPEAIAFGEKLFFDTRMSADGRVACATCHQPEKAFTDGKTLGAGIGKTRRHTPTVIGAALSPWLFWDGRADSLWAQALQPLEDPAEHGTDRLQVVRLVVAEYRTEYEAIFGSLPEELLLVQSENPLAANYVFANIGKSLGAFQSTLLPTDSRFDSFARELLETGESDQLNREEQQGLKLFIDEDGGRCMNCHNGPLFTNHDFVVTGITDTVAPLGHGRLEGIEKALGDPFNCRGIFSDTPDSCGELDFAKRGRPELDYAFKVPTLRNVALTAPYMHNGSLTSLIDVLHFYNRARSQYPPEKRGDEAAKKQHLDIEPLRLASGQLAWLEAFLKTLNSPVSKTE
ncbi:MAG: cytochrome c peroxidase [Sneathiella sp.]